MPAPRPPRYDDVRAALDAQWELLIAAFADADPTQPSRCAGWTVRDLHAHLTSITTGLERSLAAPEPPRADGGLAAWAQGLPGLASRIDDEARSSSADLAAAVAVARAALEGADPVRLVAQRTGAHRLADALLFRLVETVVHGRDLPDPVLPATSALQIVTRALAGLLAERAPGRHVEVRVPPYAAIQCVEGPRHTRGTPPNVVEAEPVVFTELVAGRTTWADAVRDGRVRSWGDRADLSPWLPLLE